jgi:hypothetical protein
MYFKKVILYTAQAQTCTKGQESKLQAVEMKFLTGIAENTGETELETHTLAESSKWKK